MKHFNILFPTITKYHQQKVSESLRNCHGMKGLKQIILPPTYSNTREFDSSLFFTNIPARKEGRKVTGKFRKVTVPSGSLVIECKNKALNHYSGIQYGKFDVIPYASKGWHHRKAYGDYFSILPVSEHPAFLTKEDLPITFEENGVSEKVIEQLAKINVTHPTVIQAKSIQKLLCGHNVFMSAECGSGKTLAYVIAMVENVLKWKDKIPSSYNAPTGIILVPTRELALQIGNLVKKLGTPLGLACEVMIGGDVESLISHPSMAKIDILTCTLKVMIEHLKAKLYSVEFCKHLVVDECDTFIDSSFIGQTRRFIQKSKLNFTGFASPAADGQSCAQICFVSATVPAELEGTLSEIIQGNEMEIISTPYLHKPFTYARQVFKRVRKSDKPGELLKIVKNNDKAKIPTMIFCNRLVTSTWLYKFLCDNQIECGRISKRSYPLERLMYFRDFEAGLINFIICTDVASRGLDFRKVEQVINYEFPTFMIDYIHRCGRTGRIGQGDDCTVTNFISGKHEFRLLQKIEMAVRTNSVLTSINQNRQRFFDGTTYRK